MADGSIEIGQTRTPGGVPSAMNSGSTQRSSAGGVWLTRFAWFTALATLGLICIGGLVTSHGAGLSVPDWPNTYGYNMFFFPISQWVGGIFYEHTHRLAASGVGLLTTILAVWLWLQEPRRWVRWLGVAAFLGVVLQGVLGGLRVTLIQNELGMVHATLAQLFLVLLAAIALFRTAAWQEGLDGPGLPAGRRWWLTVTAAAVLLQLGLGAGMRHQHAGLAVSDFPLAYGQLWPDTSPAAIEAYNRQRLEAVATAPLTAAHIHLHMAHRLGGVLILGLTVVNWAMARRGHGAERVLRRYGGVTVGLVLLQLGLGAATVWTGKSADIATAHVALGATLLVVVSLTAMWAWVPAMRPGPADGFTGEGAWPQARAISAGQKT